MKKILSILLVLILIIGNSSIVIYQGESSPRIMGIEPEKEFNYANNVYLKHLHSLINSGELKGSLSEYSLGQSFTIFNIEEKTNSTCFPVLYKTDMVAILEINKAQGEYVSTLSKSFAEELEKGYQTIKRVHLY